MRSSKKKDRDENFGKYERDLMVPYYLRFCLDKRDLTLYRLNDEGRRYDAVVPDEHGRRALPEVEIEVGLVDGWVRFWFRGRLLLPPVELDRESGEARAELDRVRRLADGEKQRAERLAARLRALGIDPEG